MEELSLAVVGINYPNADKSNRRFELAICVPGEPVQLISEPKNKHDPAAIAVFSARGLQIGYLSAERSPWIGARIRTGEEYEALFQALDTHTATIRIRFGGGAPALPTPRPRAAAPDQDDWLYRDPDGPEWGA